MSKDCLDKGCLSRIGKNNLIYLSLTLEGKKQKQFALKTSDINKAKTIRRIINQGIKNLNSFEVRNIWINNYLKNQLNSDLQNIKITENSSSGSGIYKITNIINEKIYIGSAANIKKRWQKHKNRLNNNSHTNKHLQSAWNKYRETNFKFEIIETTSSEKNTLLEREQFWINKLNVCDREIGYNLNPVAGSSQDIIMSKKTKNKISDTLKQRGLMKGSNNPFAKLNENKVAIIKKMINNNVLTLKEIAELVDVRYECIKNIRNGKSWSHINPKGVMKY